MQRYFSTFPGSWSGVDLLLLRIVAGGAASMQGVVHLSRTLEPNKTRPAETPVVVSGLALLAGFLTPASSAIAGLTTGFIVATWTPPGTSVLIDRFVALIPIVDLTPPTGRGLHRAALHRARTRYQGVVNSIVQECDWLARETNPSANDSRRRC